MAQKYIEMEFDCYLQILHMKNFFVLYTIQFMKSEQNLIVQCQQQDL